MQNDNVVMTVQFQCGCGWLAAKKTGDLPGQAQKAALAHVQETGHGLTVTGTVRKVKNA